MTGQQLRHLCSSDQYGLGSVGKRSCSQSSTIYEPWSGSNWFGVFHLADLESAVPSWTLAEIKICVHLQRTHPAVSIQRWTVDAALQPQPCNLSGGPEADSWVLNKTQGPPDYYQIIVGTFTSPTRASESSSASLLHPDWLPSIAWVGMDTYSDDPWNPPHLVTRRPGGGLRASGAQPEGRNRPGTKPRSTVFIEILMKLIHYMNSVNPSEQLAWDNY